MKRLRYTYRSVTEFSSTVCEHSFLLRPLPAATPLQQPGPSSIILDPQPDSISCDTDKWGAELRYGIIRQPHKGFSFTAAGEVTVREGPIADPHPSPVFLLPTDVTGYISQMKLLRSEGRSLDDAKQICGMVKRYMDYVPGSTGIDTSAATAFMQGKGVCQDFAHIMIAICRECGIPARYVCGFVRGEGETHAWTEVWVEGSWYGLDPTSGLPADDGYISVARGRDAADCSVSRGIFTGCALQSTQTTVSVEETDQL